MIKRLLDLLLGRVEYCACGEEMLGGKCPLDSDPRNDDRTSGDVGAL